MTIKKISNKIIWNKAVWCWCRKKTKESKKIFLYHVAQMQLSWTKPVQVMHLWSCDDGHVICWSGAHEVLLFINCMPFTLKTWSANGENPIIKVLVPSWKLFYKLCEISFGVFYHYRLFFRIFVLLVVNFRYTHCICTDFLAKWRWVTAVSVQSSSVLCICNYIVCL